MEKRFLRALLTVCLLTSVLLGQAAAGQAPERIFLSLIDMSGDWMQWQESEAVEVLRPETEWEGADLKIAPSRRGHIDERVNPLRDPAIFEEDGKVYLLYSIAGEHGLAIAELLFE